MFASYLVIILLAVVVLCWEYREGWWWWWGVTVVLLLPWLPVSAASSTLWLEDEGNNNNQLQLISASRQIKDRESLLGASFTCETQHSCKKYDREGSLPKTSELDNQKQSNRSEREGWQKVGFRENLEFQHSCSEYWGQEKRNNQRKEFTLQ